MRLLADRPRSCLDPWLLLLSSQPPARVVEALRQHVLQPAAVLRWPERGSNLQPIRIRTRLSGELAAGRLLPCVRGSTALALARVTSMRTFGGEGREGKWIRRCQGRKGLAQPSHLHIPDRGREPRGIQSAVQRARRAPWTGGGHGAEVDRAPPGRCRARLRSHRPRPSSAIRQSPPGRGRALAEGRHAGKRRSSRLSGSLGDSSPLKGETRTVLSAVGWSGKLVLKPPSMSAPPTRRRSGCAFAAAARTPTGGGFRARVRGGEAARLLVRAGRLGAALVEEVRLREEESGKRGRRWRRGRRRSRRRRGRRSRTGCGGR